METRRKLGLGVAAVVIVAVLAVAGWYGWRVMEERADREWYLSMLPEMPAQDSISPQLYNAISSAYRNIEEGGDPVLSAGHLTRLYQANGYLNEAIQGLDLLLQIDPENPLWPHLLAFILAGYGELETALTLWEKTIELEPDYLPAQLRMGEALIKLNRLDDAQDTFIRVQIKEPQNPHAYHGLARIAFTREQYDFAQPLLAKALRNSGDAVGIQLMVTVLDRLGRTEEANAIRGRAKALEGYSDIPDPWVFNLNDVCYDTYQLVTAAGNAAYAGNIDKAIELNRRAISLDPDYAFAYFHQGATYREVQNWDEAVRNFQKARELDPKISDAWLFEGQIYIDQGLPEKGIELWLRGLQHNPDSPALHLSYGEHLLQKGLSSEALIHFKRSAELRPQEPEAYIAQARIYFQRNELEKARQLALDALNAETANPIALNMIVVVSIAMKDENEAAKWIRLVRRQPRIDEQARQQLAEFFETAFGHPPS